MSHIIGLSSIRLAGQDMVYLEVNELDTATIFSLDKSLRSIIRKSPCAEWHQFVDALKVDDFTEIRPSEDSLVFVHSRSWDEHLVSYGQSFFVTFPDGAPYKLAGKLFFASQNAYMYTSVNADYCLKNGVILLDAEHDPVYFDDLAWTDTTHMSKASIGELILIREQFSDDSEYVSAKQGVVAWISKKTSFGLDARVYTVAVEARTEFGRASAIMRFKTATPMAASHHCASDRRERSRAPIMGFYLVAG